MNEFSSKQFGLYEFTAAAASRDPVPGGGGVSALTGALAACLSQMVTNLTIGKKRYLDYTDELTATRDEAEELRISLLSCIDEDAAAFAPLAKAYALPKDSQGYAEMMEDCLRNAAKPPFRILKLASKIVDLDERLAVIGSKLAVSDAATSVILAHSAMYGAFMNIIVNTRLMKDRAYAERINKEADALLKEHSEKALEIYNSILGRLTNG